MNNYMPIKQTTQKKWINPEKHSLPRLNQEKIENMNKPFTANEIDSVIQKTHKK